MRKEITLSIQNDTIRRTQTIWERGSSRLKKRYTRKKAALDSGNLVVGGEAFEKLGGKGFEEGRLQNLRGSSFLYKKRYYKKGRGGIWGIQKIVKKNKSFQKTTGSFLDEVDLGRGSRKKHLTEGTTLSTIPAPGWMHTWVPQGGSTGTKLFPKI